MNFLDILSYGFVIRGFEAGIIIALIAPLIGIFLVLRRYSLIADTLAHVSLAGVALGFLTGISPILTALGVTAVSSLGIERLRESKLVYGESSLALFLSGSLAIATILLSIGKGFGANLFNYLFGSIVTVTQTDVYTIAIIGAVVAAVVAVFYKELISISFDDDFAQVSGIPVRRINAILILLAAVTIALAIPIVGALLISALIVIPVVTALQFRKSFSLTLIIAEVCSLVSVISGILLSIYFNLATGGTIVLVMLAIFLLALSARPR
jgi:zinc transport system permease protein